MMGDEQLSIMALINVVYELLFYSPCMWATTTSKWNFLSRAPSLNVQHILLPRL